VVGPTSCGFDSFHGFSDSRGAGVGLVPRLSDGHFHAFYQSCHSTLLAVVRINDSALKNRVHRCFAVGDCPCLLLCVCVCVRAFVCVFVCPLHKGIYLFNVWILPWLSAFLLLFLFYFFFPCASLHLLPCTLFLFSFPFFVPLCCFPSYPKQHPLWIVTPTKLRHESFSHWTARSEVRVWPRHDASTACSHAAHCLDSVYSATAQSPSPIVKSNDNMHNIYKYQTHVAQLRLKPS
jgi:hypothetical protein